MENKQKQFRCTGDCLNCRAMNDRKIQWQYCASQHAYNSMRMLQQMQQNIEAMASELMDMKAKVAAIQDNEAMVFNPNEESSEAEPVIGAENNDIAQEGDGAEPIEAPR